MGNREAQASVRPLTHRALTVERNRFLIAFLIMFGINVVFRTAFHFRLPDWEVLGGFAVFFVVAARVVYVFLVYHLSRFLGQPLWLTLLYCVLAVFAGFELIPLIALLVGIRRTRETIEESPQKS